MTYEPKSVEKVASLEGLVQEEQMLEKPRG